jgi:hypothetical protein
MEPLREDWRNVQTTAEALRAAGDLKGAAREVQYGRGRDLDEFEKAMTFDKITGSWAIQGDADEVRRSGEKNAIRRALLEARVSMSPAEISLATGMKGDSVRFLLFKMVAAGQVLKVERARCLHPDLSTPANIANSANDYRFRRHGKDP